MLVIEIIYEFASSGGGFRSTCAALAIGADFTRVANGGAGTRSNVASERSKIATRDSIDSRSIGEKYIFGEFVFTLALPISPQRPARRGVATG